MKLKRIGRDSLVLLAFCGLFYLFLVAAGGLDDGSKDDIVDFSKNRILADKSTKSKDWKTALVSLENLIEKDPYDGRAQFEYARTHFRRWATSCEEIDGLDLETEDADKVAGLQAVRDNYARLTIAELQKAKQHFRYQGRALLWLASVHANQRQPQEAIEALREFVDAQYFTFEGLSGDETFGRGGPSMASGLVQTPNDALLHAEHQFWSIVRDEQSNRARRKD